MSTESKCGDKASIGNFYYLFGGDLTLGNSDESDTTKEKETGYRSTVVKNMKLASEEKHGK